MPKGQCVFNANWLTEKDYRSWLQDVQNDKHAFYCRVCKKQCDLRSMGESALRTHMGGKKHKDLAKLNRPTVSLTSYLAASGPSRGTSSLTSLNSTDSASSSTSTGRNLAQPTVMKEALVTGLAHKAEVFWTINAVNKHYSFKSAENNGDIFRKMFPDSEIATKYQCSETKSRYLATFGIAPHFLTMLKDRVKAESQYVLIFDESLNHELKQKQLDIHLRFWGEKGVVTEYYTSEFLGHSYATSIIEALDPHLAQLGYNHLLQLSMDGPSVNWKAFDDLQAGMDKNHAGVKMLQTGSCGLHVMHNTFRAGCVATKWDIEDFLRSAYILFEDCPARREDFMEVTQQNKFPLKFCAHRWLENEKPAERARELLPHLTTFINAARSRKITLPANKSFQMVVNATEDPLITAKLRFFSLIASEVQPFLEKYQTDRPMLPFMGTDMYLLMKDLLERVIKQDVLDNKGGSLIKLLNMNLGSHNQRPLEQIKVGHYGRGELTKSCLSTNQRREFRESCKNFIITMIQKLKEKSPVTYPLVRNLRALDPRIIATKESRDALEKHMHMIVNTLIKSNWCQSEDADKFMSQWSKLLNLVQSDYKMEFLEFDPDNPDHHLDVLLMMVVGGDKRLGDLWSVLRKLLILSHGQGAVERGFSVNKEAVSDNLSEMGMVAKRQILNHVRQCGGVMNVNLSDELMISVKSACTKYHQHLEAQREKEVKEKAGNKRKALEDNVAEMERKKRKLESDIEQLNDEADKLSEEAEQKKQFYLITKSNALRAKAKSVRQELAALQKDMEEEVKKLSAASD